MRLARTTARRAAGIPVYREVNLPSGTALAGAWDACDIYIGSEFRIDVSSEAGSRFDQNITGFRGEEEFGFNAEPYVRPRMVRSSAFLNTKVFSLLPGSTTYFTASNLAT